MLRRIREWRIDRMTDRVARRPHGRAARKTYGADDVHSWAWDPVLDALQLTPDDALLDVGCGGGVFLRRALETGCGAVGVDHSNDMVQLARETTGGRAPIVHASAEKLPFEQGAFTAVSSLSWRSSSFPIRSPRCASSTAWSIRSAAASPSTRRRRS